ncbi:hypothetical protein WG66_011390 [Moniliophthora roreri]|nr:hypothetical protein WG66_011390 [Moniliophthora roreri]
MLRSQRGKEICYLIGQKPVFSKPQNYEFRNATSPLTRWEDANELSDAMVSGPWRMVTWRASHSSHCRILNHTWYPHSRSSVILPPPSLYATQSPRY